MNASILKQTGFLPFLATRVFAMLAIQIQSVIVGWHVYDATRNPMALAYVGLSQFVPMAACLPIAGDIADRYNRKWVLGIGLAVACVCSLMLMGIMLAGKDYVYWAYAVLMIFGAARSFINPVLQSLLPQIVPRESLPQSIATNSALIKLATILGPVAGGVLYSISSHYAYLACSASFLLAIVPLFWVTLRYAHKLDPSDTFRLGKVWARFLEGGRFITSKPIILGAMLLDLLAVLLGGVVALLPIYASDVLHVGAQGLGLLRSSIAVGEIAAGVYLARFPIRRSVGKLMFASVALFGLANLVFALSTSFWLSLAALALTGLFDMISVNIRSSLIQLATPDAMRGRVTAVNMLFITSSNELGEFRAGLSARWLGVVPTAVLGSLFSLGVVLVMMQKFPSLRMADTFADAEEK